MAFPFPHIRLSFGGTQADGLEIWSCGHALVDATAATVDPLTWFDDVKSMSTGISSAIERFIGDADTRVSNNTKVKWLKLALIGTDGKYMVEPGVYELDWGGAINAPYSPQDAMVVTLISPVWRGAGRYNRFYVPTAGPAGTNAWCFSTAEQGLFAASAQEYLEDLNTLLDGGSGTANTKVGVVSNTGAGSAFYAVEVMAGRIVDTQRRRRNALTEDYVTLPVDTLT